jgi:DNA modification methylase
MPRSLPGTTRPRTGCRDADTPSVTNRLPLAPTAFADGITVYHGDAIRVLHTLPDASVDAVVCDPPYAIAPIGHATAGHLIEHGTAAPDQCATCGGSPASGYAICHSCLDGVKADAFAASGMLGQQSQNWNESTTHSRGYADNDNAQFGEWCLMWLRECLRLLKPGGHLVAFGGTRTWHRLAVSAEDAGFEIRDSLAWLYATGFPKSVDVATAIAKRRDRGADSQSKSGSGTVTATPEWNGWGTALKPAHEPIVFARKPLVGTVAENVLEFQTGALNIGETRLAGDRWPSNVFLDSAQAGMLDDVSDGRASRFFWVAKPDQTERVTVAGVSHPTVKPLALMRELVRLVTPAGGIVLEPFAGSGSTVEACLLEGLRCIAVERDATYIPLIKQRIDRRKDPVAAVLTPGRDDAGLFELF